MASSLFKSISAASSTLAEPIIETILDLIRNGSLQEGDKLPPQNILAGQLRVSRTSLREALKELSYRGIVTCVHGRGTFVSERLVSTADIIEARAMLEPGVAALAATRADARSYEELASLVDKMESRVDARDFKGFSILDLEFHIKINDMSANRALSFMMRALRDVMLVQQLYIQKLPGAIERAYKYHRKILLTIKNHDAQAASEIMREHLTDVADAAKQSVTESGAGGVTDESFQ
ncbi:GntR family transcriptional regulator [Synergistales bacterium]|nr:GntR family transcriptional regulator [Synergistales bacterium]